jgi:hypothetical protein
MLDTLKQTIVINFSITLNSFIYFLKRGKLTRFIFHGLGYEHAAFTEVLVILGMIYAMLQQMFKSFFLFALGLGLPYLILKDDMGGVKMESAYWQLFIIFYLLMSLGKNKILEPERRKYISVKMMKMNARQFVISDYFPPLIWRQIVELLVFSIAAALFSVNILLVFFLLVGKNFLSIFAEVLHIKYYDITGDFLHNKAGLTITFYLICLVAGYFITLNRWILQIPTPIIIALGAFLWGLGLYSILFILRYKNFSMAFNESNSLEKVNIDKQAIQKNAAFAQVKLKNKEFTQEELRYDTSNKKEGFRYINDIFFKRHKRILNGPIKLQVVIILLLIVGCFVASLFVPDFNSKYITVVKSIFPAFIFALYVMSTGPKATKAMFYNCDISLLHYGFYKTKEAVLATFTIRAIHLIIANMIPAGLFTVGIILVDILTGGSGTSLIAIGIMVMVLSIFFVIHNLFLYYIFQPYTTDLSVKNPMFKLLNFITYILCYISMQLRNMSSAFLIVVVATTFIYSIAALITVYKVAPKTFIIK